MPKQRQRYWNCVFDTRNILNTCIKSRIQNINIKNTGRWIAIMWQDNIDIILKMAQNNLKFE